jgi:membrane carboxypeptidase/penicillin-binding protein
MISIELLYDILAALFVSPVSLCYDNIMSRFWKRIKKYKWVYYIALIPLVVALGAFYYFILRDLPSPTRLQSNSLPQSTRIYDRNDTLLYTIYASRNQTFLPLTKVPKSVQYATIAIEDKDFYRHGAVDFRGIVRAFSSTCFTISNNF